MPVLLVLCRIHNPRCHRAHSRTVPLNPAQADIFLVMMLSGNISCCQGCSGKILQGGGVASHYCHLMTWLCSIKNVLFQNPKSGIFQLSRELRSVYYHPCLSCILSKFPSFQAGQQLGISKEALCKLSAIHKDHIAKEFGIQFISK